MVEDGAVVSETLVPVHLDGRVVYLSSSVVRPGATGDEVEVAARPASLDDAVAGLVAFAEKVADAVRKADVTRLNVELSCEFAVESGKFVAIVGKASAKSGVKVGLEWERPTS